MTLSDFLLARIAEDEAAARRVAEQMREAVSGGNWKDLPETDAAANLGPRVEEDYHGFPVVVVSPARVLAECEAKRRIVELHTGWHLCPDGREADATVGSDTDESWRLCPTLRLLALPYSAHPDFKEEWKP